MGRRRMFTPENAPEVLAREQLDAIHDQAMTILEEIGTDVRHEEALELLRSHGQHVDGERVRWDREFVMEMVAKAPESFTLRPRNPEREVTIGGGSLVLAPVGGSPFAHDLRARAARRHDGRPRRAGEDGARGRPDRLPAGRHGRGHRPPRGQPAHGHGLLDPALVGQAVRLLRHVRPQGARRRQPGGDRLRRPRGDRADAGRDGRRQPQQPAGLGLADGRRADRVGRRPTSR